MMNLNEAKAGRRVSYESTLGVVSGVITDIVRAHKCVRVLLDTGHVILIAPRFLNGDQTRALHDRP
jgi:hypothetical protein